MATEIPMDLINQLQISLRKEARLSSYDPRDASLPCLPSAEDALAGLDPSPPYLRCRYCKGKLLRGIESLICVFCGKQQRTCDNPPDSLKFTSTSGYRWLLSSLNLDGSERVEPPKEASGLTRTLNAPVEEIPLSSFLDLEIQWHVEEEKLTTSNSNEKSVKSKVPLNLGGVDLDNFFIEGRGSVPEVKLAQSNPADSTLYNDFTDPQSLSLFENVESTGSSVLRQHQHLSLFEKKDSQESFSSKEHGDRSLFEGKDAQENFSSKEHENLSLFKGKDAQESSSSKERENLSSFESVQPSEAAAKFVEDKISDSASSWEVDFQSADKQNILEEPKSVDPFFGSSVDLSANMETVFGSGKDFSDGKPKDSSAASGSNAGNWFEDDLFSNVSNQVQQSNGTVCDNDAGTSSMNIDWIQNDLWQTSTKKASDSKATDDTGDEDWNDFASSTNVKSPSSSSFKQSGAGTFDGTTNVKNGGRTETGKSSFDWIQDDKCQIGTSTLSDKSNNQEDDLFGAWNDFTGSKASQAPSTTSVQQSADHKKPSVEQTSEMDLFDMANNQEGFDLGGFSQPDFFSGGVSNQNNSAEVNVVQLEASASDRAGNAAGKDQMTEDATDDVFNTNYKSKTDDVETLMSQMHDLSFMLESKLSVPSNPKEEGFS